MISNPKIEVLKDAYGDKIFKLLEALNLDIGDGAHVIVPDGYLSDGASVPRFFWRILSPEIDPITLAPSIGHDYLYEKKMMTRKETDQWYRKELIENGYPKWKATLTYWGVRLFGWRHWDD